MTSYQYDGIGRLTTLTKDLAGTAYDGEWGLTYAPSGQIIGRSQTNDAAYTWMPSMPNSTVSAQFDGQNRLTNSANSTVSVGPNGEVGSLGGNTYNYDQQEQLIKATVNNQEVQLEYDPTGMLSKITVNNNTSTEFLYDGPHRLAIRDRYGSKS